MVKTDPRFCTLCQKAPRRLGSAGEENHRRLAGRRRKETSPKVVRKLEIVESHFPGPDDGPGPFIFNLTFYPYLLI